MAGPINGIGGQQSFPASNTFQPTQDGNNVRQREDAQPRENTVQPRGAAAAETQTVETENQNVSRSGFDSQLSELSGNEPRGSLIDITV